MQAIGEKIVVRQQEETETPGGIQLPVNKVSPYNKGIVVSIGSEVNIGLKVGDNILYEGFGVEINNHTILHKSSVLAKL